MRTEVAGVVSQFYSRFPLSPPSHEMVMSHFLSHESKSYRETPQIQTLQILNFRKSKQVSKIIGNLKTHEKWKKMIYLAIITITQNKNKMHKNESNTVTAGIKHRTTDRSDCLIVICNVLYERREWIGILSLVHARQTIASLPSLVIFCQSTSLTSLITP